jgi:predicted GNAT superfamily acetyltransferase
MNMSESAMAGITLRQLCEPQEMQMCVQVQKTVWGFSDLELVPLRMFVVAVRTSGQVIGAFDGKRLIGFAMSVAAHRNGELYLHSHMTAVLPEYQNRSIGRQLKLAQREDALSRGINLIEWTFDPLQLRNAHFNIARLGAIVREYLTNIYGHTSSPLHHGLPTDRLVAQWWIRDSRVEQVLSKQGAERLTVEEQVCIPRNILEICDQDPGKAKEVQSQVRGQFQRLFADGFAVTGFELDKQTGKYLLQRL